MTCFVLAWTVIACQNDFPSPELASIAPTSQDENESVLLTVSGGSFHPKVEHKVGDDDEFSLDNGFVVRFTPVTEGEGDPFELESVQRKGVSELVGDTPANASPNL